MRKPHLVIVSTIVSLLVPSSSFSDSLANYVCQSPSKTVDGAKTKSSLPKKLTQRELDNLVAFTKLLGYVRYFHPSDQAARLDWNKFAIAGVKSVENAMSSRELALRLEKLFHPIAPTVRIILKNHGTKLAASLRRPSSRLPIRTIAWVHNGPDFSNPYKYLSKRVDEKEFPAQASFPKTKDPFAADLDAGITCIVPLSLYADSVGTFPHTSDSSSFMFPNTFVPSVNDRTTRIADIVIAWNIFEHLYPYFDMITTNWNQMLRLSLSSAAKDSTDIAFERTLKWMQVQLRDGHGVASGFRNTNYSRQMWYLPFTAEWIEDQLVITKIQGNTPSTLRVGDVIEKINGSKSGQYLRDQEQYIPASTQQMKRWWSTFLFPHALVEKFEIELQRESQMSETVLFVKPKESQKQTSEWKAPEPKPQELRKGIYYLDLEWLTYSDFESSLNELSNAKGLIFDMRSYPNKIGEHFMSHLIDSTILVPPYYRPLVTRPNRMDMKFIPVEARFIQPHGPRLKGKIIFLTGPRAMSFPEHLLLMVQYYGLGQIVGESTAGTNGNINWVSLPTGYDLVWTALRVLRFDGSRFNGLGIRPTIEVHRTLKALKERRDEALEKAVEILSR